MCATKLEGILRKACMVLIGFGVLAACADDATSIPPSDAPRGGDPDPTGSGGGTGAADGGDRTTKKGPTALDPSFGDGGILRPGVVSTMGGGIRSLLIQPDGRLLVAGTQTTTVGQDTNTELIVARFEGNGSPDTSFGVGGFAKFATPSLFGSKLSMGLQSDGKLVVASWGQDKTSTSTHVYVRRLSTSGVLDGSFMSGGTVDVLPSSTALSMTILPDDRIVVAGTTAPTNADLVVRRFLPGGGPDKSFNSTGTLTLARAGEQEVLQLAQAPSGALLALARCMSNDSFDFCVARVTSEGKLDSSFGSGGWKVNTFAGATSTAFYAAAPHQGGLVVGGAQLVPSSGFPSFALSKISFDTGAPMPAFANGLLRDSETGSMVQGVAVDAEDRVVFAGHHYAPRPYAGMVGRTTADGTLDPSFGEGGLFVFPIVTTSEYVTGGPVAIQSDGKIVVAGAASAEREWFIARVIP